MKDQEGTPLLVAGTNRWQDQRVGGVSELKFISRVVALGGLMQQLIANGDANYTIHKMSEMLKKNQRTLMRPIEDAAVHQRH